MHMFVSAVGQAPVRAITPVKRVDRSLAEAVATEEAELMPLFDRRQPKRKRPPIVVSRTATERSSPGVLAALAVLKLGG